MNASPSAVAQGRGQPWELAPLLVKPPASTAMMKYALYLKKRHKQNAEDLVGETVFAALKRQSGTSPYCGPPPPLEKWLGSVMNGVLANELRTQERRITMVHSKKGTGADPGATDHPEDELDAAARERAEDQEREQLMAELRAFFEKQPNGRIPLGILDCASREIDKAQDIADELSCTVAEVYDAKDRVKHHLKRIHAARAAAAAEGGAS